MARQPSRPYFQTLADLVHWLGDVPLDRICGKPPPGLAVEADVLAARRMPERWLCELVDGVLIHKAADFRASVVSTELLCRIYQLHEVKHRGVLLPGSMPFQLAPGLVRIPDISFIPWDRFSGGQLPDEEIGTTIPSLVVEVVSVFDAEREIERKRQEYFRAGVQEVWIIDSVQRTATIWDTSTSVQRFPSQGTLRGSQVFDDFSLALGDLFACSIVPRKRDHH